MSERDRSIQDAACDAAGRFRRPDLIDTAVLEETSELDSRQESTPMLEAHALYEPIHSWKSFFIHVATICVGLLIAIGLEQSVEYVHHRNQLREARQELALEIEVNNAKIDRTLEAVRKETAMLETDTARLRLSAELHDPTWPTLEYSWRGPEWPEDWAWKVLRQSGSLALMPHDELRRYSYLYDGIAAVQVAFMAYAEQSDIAESLAHRSTGARVLRSDIQEMLAATAQCQGRLRFFASALQLEKIGLEAASRHALN